jgi:hypothetical protein
MDRPRRFWVALLGALAATVAVGVPLLFVAARGEETVPSRGLLARVDEDVSPLDGARLTAGRGELILTDDDVAAVAFALYRGDELVVEGQARDGSPFALVSLVDTVLPAGEYELLATTVDEGGRSAQVAAMFSMVGGG